MAREGLAERIDRLRGLVDLSARELSGLAGLHHSHIGWIEKKGDRVSAVTVAKIAEVFGVSLDWLVSDVGPAPTKESLVSAVERARRARRRLASQLEKKTGTSG